MRELLARKTRSSEGRGGREMGLWEQHILRLCDVAHLKTGKGARVSGSHTERAVWVRWGLGVGSRVLDHMGF